MQSKKSFFNGPLFNRTLYRKNLTRFWPLWGGLSLVGCLMPLYLLMSLLSPYFLGVVHAHDIAMVLYTLLAHVIPILTMIYALFVAMATWGYLYSARSVGLMHTLPIHRLGLFVTNLLSGLTMLLLPYAIVGILTGIVCLAFGIFPPAAVLHTIFGVLCLTLFYYAFATLCAMVTSHLFALPVFYLIGNFFAIGLYWLLSLFASNFIFGYAGRDTTPDWVSFLSPATFIQRHMRTFQEYSEELETYISRIQGLWVVGVYALIGRVLLALAYLLYRARHSESAGDVVAYRFLKPVFRYGVALCGALTLGQLLYELLWGSIFQSGLYYQIVPMAICMVIGGTIGYYIASMLLAKSLRVFRGSWRGPLVTAGMVVVLCAVVSLDVFGIAHRLPDREDVFRIGAYCPYYSGYDHSEISCRDLDDPLAQQIMALQQMILDHEGEIRATSNRRADDRWSYMPIYFYYDLQDGSTMERKYYLSFTREQWEDPSTYAGAVNALFNSPAAARNRLAPLENVQLTHLYFYPYYVDGYSSSESGTYTDQQLQLLRRALIQDAEEGNFPPIEPFSAGSTRHPGGTDFGSIELEYRTGETFDPEDSYGASYRGFSTQVYFSMTHTIDALLELELLTPEQLQEIAQAVGEKYGEEEQALPDAGPSAEAVDMDPDSFTPVLFVS